MNFKTRSLIVLMIISMFLLSSCEVYQTLYGTNTPAPSGQEAPQNEAITEEEVMENTPEETEVPEEAEISEEDAMEETPDETEVQEDVMETQEPEIVPVKSEEKPLVIVVQETDLVDLVPKAEDPDNDDLVVSFTSPLNDDGQWQTTYGDAGEYTVTVTVSDGQAAAARDVLIIVNKKEESPVIDNTKPIESALAVFETESVDFSIAASDLNNDPLSYTWKLDGAIVSEASSYNYQSDYDSAGTHTVKVDVTDGTSTASKIWSVEALNVNRKPVLEQIGDITARETEMVTITALATDDDMDTIIYSISDSRFSQDGNVFTWQTDYDSAGTYEVTVSSSDGTDTAQETFTLTVENVNRPPVINDVVQR